MERCFVVAIFVIGLPRAHRSRWAEQGEIMRGRTIVAAALLALAWGGAVSAEQITTAPWVNLAHYTSVTTTGGDTGALWHLVSPYSFTGRWHQGVAVTEGNPVYIDFDLGQDNSAWVSFARMYNASDNSGGRFSYHLEYLPAGADPGIAGNWVKLDETQRVDRRTNDGDVFVFDQPVNARILRWVLTDGPDNNFRFSKFEFFTQNQRDLNLANLPGATLTWSTDPTVLGSDATNAHDGNITPRFESGYPNRQAQAGDPENFGQQYVTLMLPEAYQMQLLRLYSEDADTQNPKWIDLFSIEYLLADGVTWQTVPGLGNLTQQSNISEYDLSLLPPTEGLRMNIVNPSNQGHNILRLWEFEAFGNIPIPEPVTITLLTLGGLVLLRRRK